MLTLLRATTGENWHDLLRLLSKDTEIDYQCIKNPTYEDYVEAGYETVGCGNPMLATIYFNTFYLFGSMIFLNLFIGIVLQGFSDTNKIQAELFSKDVQDTIIDKWGDQDPDATSILNKK
jgi:voltage-dependent calcium channel L type alpha-1D